MTGCEDEAGGLTISSFDKSMLKVERREMGGSGEDAFRFLGGN